MAQLECKFGGNQKRLCGEIDLSELNLHHVIGSSDIVQLIFINCGVYLKF